MGTTVFLLQVHIGSFAVCEAVSRQVRSTCVQCGLGEADWEVPLQVRWKEDYSHVLGDFSLSDSSQVSNSCLVSDRVRQVLEQECSGVQFLPVLEVNSAHIQSRPDTGPLWWLKVPVIPIDIKKYGWKTVGRPCPHCNGLLYRPPGDDGYWVEEADLHGYCMFAVQQLFPHIFVRKNLKELIERQNFTNVEVPSIPALIQVGSPSDTELLLPSRAPGTASANMPAYDDLPDDPLEWRDISVSFPFLSPNTADSCPLPFDKIMNYVELESGATEEVTLERLRFVRTAQVAEDQYWLWTYTESHREVDYVFCRQKSDNSTVLGLTARNKLSPELYLLAEHYDMVYWS